MAKDALDCPSCGGRIGNRRGTCGVCNTYAQRVTRETGKRLRMRHKVEWEILRRKVERDEHARMIAEIGGHL